MPPRQFHDARLMARVTPATWLGAGAMMLALLLVGAVPSGAVATCVIVDIVAVLGGLVLFAVQHRLPDWALRAGQYVATVAIAAVISAWGDPDTSLALFLIWLVVQAAYFDHWRHALAQGAFVAVAYAGALLVAGDEAFPVLRWVMLTTTLFAVAGLVAVLRHRVTALVGRLQALAATDELTGLGNRRRLMAELTALADAATPSRTATVALFDLDGFKTYNDTFGHPAGDALLVRLGRRGTVALADHGELFRLGGDEFCAVIRGGDAARAVVLADLHAAFREHGEGFSVGASHGSVAVPGEATTPAMMLSVADRRLYRAKVAREPGPSVAAAHAAHLAGSDTPQSTLARQVGIALGVAGEQLDVLARAAALQDIGKLGVPEELLRGDAPLAPHERQFLRGYVLIGERLLDAAPPLRSVAQVVRATQERWDGSGYPDGLKGDEIPLLARIVAACSAGPESGGALAPDVLRQAAGTKLDPGVVDALLGVLAADPLLVPRAA